MLKEVIEKTINSHYDIASLKTGISEIILKEFIKGNAKITLNVLHHLRQLKLCQN